MNHSWFLIQPFWLSIISIRLLVSKGCVWFLNQPLWFPNQPVVVSESWLVFESWLVSDSTVLVIDNTDAASGFQRMRLVSESAVVVSESAFCSFRIMVGV